MDKLDGRIRVALCFLTLIGGGMLAMLLGVDKIGWAVGALTSMIALRFIV